MDWEQDSELEEGEINEDCEEKQPGDGIPGQEPCNGPRNRPEPQLSGGEPMRYYGMAPLIPWKLWTEEQRVAWWKEFEPKSELKRGVWVKWWLIMTRERNRLEGVEAMGDNVLPPFELIRRSRFERLASQRPDLANDPSAMERLQSGGGGWFTVTL
jgi:hypothetical protein